MGLHLFSIPSFTQAAVKFTRFAGKNYDFTSPLLNLYLADSISFLNTCIDAHVMKENLNNSINLLSFLFPKGNNKQQLFLILTKRKIFTHHCKSIVVVYQFTNLRCLRQSEKSDQRSLTVSYLNSLLSLKKKTLCSNSAKKGVMHNLFTFYKIINYLLLR